MRQKKSVHVTVTPSLSNISVVAMLNGYACRCGESAGCLKLCVFSSPERRTCREEGLKLSSSLPSKKKSVQAGCQVHRQEAAPTMGLIFLQCSSEMPKEESLFFLENGLRTDLLECFTQQSAGLATQGAIELQLLLLPFQ